MKHKRHQETEAVRGGTDLSKKLGPVNTPIYQTSTFEATDNEEMLRVTGSDQYYSRYGNLTNTAGEKAVAELEGAENALLFSSGMTAITTTVLALLKSGDHIVSQRDIYGGTTKFFSTWLPKLGIETTFVDIGDYEQQARSIRPNTKLIYVESPTNPTGRIVDMKKVAALGKQTGILTMIDSTFATPINQRPIEYGIDLVMHSGTKYFGGHADLLCGIIAGSRALIDEIHETRNTLGGVMDHTPHGCFCEVSKPWPCGCSGKTKTPCASPNSCHSMPKCAAYITHLSKATPTALWPWSKCAEAGA